MFTEKYNQQSEVCCFLHKQNALWITLPQKFHMKHFLKQVIHNDRRE